MWQPLLTVLTVLSLAHCGLAARLASFCALRPDILLDRRHVIKSRRAETLETEWFDEPGSGSHQDSGLWLSSLPSFAGRTRSPSSYRLREERANHIAPPGGCLAEVIELS
jgi:hypothetical protein